MGILNLGSTFAFRWFSKVLNKGIQADLIMANSGYSDMIRSFSLKLEIVKAEKICTFRWEIIRFSKFGNLSLTN